jgi:hypothetical protein
LRLAPGEVRYEQWRWPALAFAQSPSRSNRQEAARAGVAKWLGAAMPEPNRPPWLIAENIREWAIWRLVEMGVTLVIHCDACGTRRAGPRGRSGAGLGAYGARRSPMWRPGFAALRSVAGRSGSGSRPRLAQSSVGRLTIWVFEAVGGRRLFLPTSSCVRGA